ncbi:hypothetical protein CRG98_014384 [Punica granatum]|uniref:Uncharacterized protein n=1 Tax=Punica granatum TaxID=22663 RepID=A0A2I0K9L4_PUNGR|nr:hypothetical protein CRG98_014384 [Punica granatum]
MMVVWFQSYRVDPYNPAKIMKNRARPGNRPDGILGSDVTTVALDGILRQAGFSGISRLLDTLGLCGEMFDGFCRLKPTRKALKHGLAFLTR